MNILSFDIEEWFLSRDDDQFPIEQWGTFSKRVEQNTQTILELLAKHDQKATFFVLGWVAENYPKLVSAIDNAGHEIGYHSYYHKHIKSQIQDRYFENDLEKGLGMLESIIGKKVVCYRAPYFSFNDYAKDVVEILIKHGIKADSSVKAFSGTEKYFRMNAPFYFEKDGARLLEFPLNRINLPFIKPVISGSGYFRITPLQALRYFYAKSPYVMTYFHPRDFDGSKPFSNQLSFSRNVLNRIGTKQTAHKLDVILTEFKFVTICEAMNLLSTPDANTPTFNLDD